jgi:multidrug efflux pump subunit AcrA (membrane-fusion protein)
MARSFGFKATVAVAGLAALGLGFYAGRAPLARLLASTSLARTVSADRPAQPVRVTAAVFVAVEASRSFTGTVRSQHETAMAFRVAGKIVARMVDVGDAVTAGQVLARMDDADARLSLASAEAEVIALPLVDQHPRGINQRLPQLAVVIGYLHVRPLPQAQGSAAAVLIACPRPAKSCCNGRKGLVMLVTLT